MNQYRSSSYPSEKTSPSRSLAIATTERVSGRQLDFCLLALCSCALTLMCHQAISLSASSTPTSTVRPPSMGVLAQLDFTIKSGLVTTQNGDQDFEN